MSTPALDVAQNFTTESRELRRRLTYDLVSIESRRRPARQDQGNVGGTRFGE